MEDVASDFPDPVKIGRCPPYESQSYSKAGTRNGKCPTCQFHRAACTDWKEAMLTLPEEFSTVLSKLQMSPLTKQ